MKAHSSISKTTRKLAESIRSATWTGLEPKEPPISVCRFLESIDSGRVLVHGPIVIREKKPTPRPPNMSAWKVTPGE